MYEKLSFPICLRGNAKLVLCLSGREKMSSDKSIHSVLCRICKSRASVNYKFYYPEGYKWTEKCEMASKVQISSERCTRACPLSPVLPISRSLLSNIFASCCCNAIVSQALRTPICQCGLRFCRDEHLWEKLKCLIITNRLLTCFLDFSSWEYLTAWSARKQVAWPSTSD